jgi:hypothetical protein
MHGPASLDDPDMSLPPW